MFVLLFCWSVDVSERDIVKNDAMTAIGLRQGERKSERVCVCARECERVLLCVLVCGMCMRGRMCMCACCV